MDQFPPPVSLAARKGFRCLAPAVFWLALIGPAWTADAPPPASSLPDLATQFERTPDTVVAQVDGTPITLGMVADRLRDFPEKLSALPSSLVYKGAVDDLVQQRILAVKAKALGLDKLPDTQRRILEATDRELGRALYRRIVPELVNDAAIEKAYQSTIAGKPGPTEVRFRVIATGTEAEANTVIDSLGQGADFAGIAQKFSKDASGPNGGLIDYVRRERLGPEIGAVVFALQPGQTTPFPVASNGLWFVIRVEGRRQQATPSLAESKGLLSAELTQAAVAEIMQKSRAAVVVNDFGPTGQHARDQSAAPKAR